MQTMKTHAMNTTLPLLATLFLIVATPIAAESEQPISTEEQRQILEKIAAELRRGYLYEDKGKAFAEEVKTAAGDERFAASDTLGAFVSAVNGFLLEVSNDKHLRLRSGALPNENAGRRRMVRRRAPGGHAPGGHAMQPGHASQPGHGPQPGHAPDAGGDFGVREARVLDGNVGYLDLRMFAGSEAAKPAIDQAMTALAGTGALIIDLGRNGGGGPWMVRYLSGFFFDRPTHLASTWARGMDAPRERWTLDGQPTDAFVDKPVYILTSRRTFSAAESFTFGLKINHRVTLVGERTGGGGHFGDTISVSPDLSLFMPGGRTYDPKTGQGWEAEGIAPDIEADYADAQERALQAIKASN